ncbi:MAG: hypothetical protein ACP5LW_05790 [Nitrososphaeria archaeon]
MVLVLASKLMAAASGAVPRSGYSAANAVQIYGPGRMSVWSGKAIIIRNAPFTINYPSPKQLEVRIKFGEIAQQAKGQTGLVNGLPPAAALIHERAGEIAAAAASAPSRVIGKRTFHTLEQLKRMRESYRSGRTGRGTMEIF